MKRRDNIIKKTISEKSIPENKLNVFESALTKLDNLGFDLSFEGKVKNIVVQPQTKTFADKMIAQAIYFVANNEKRKARDCLKAIGMSSFNAKGWIKEEQAVQKRNPEEKEKYFNKEMPTEFCLSEQLN